FNRLESTGNAIAIFKDNPLIGVGFNAYRYAQYRYGFIKGENWQIVHSGAGTDNSFLFVLATTGIIGLISYLYLWWVILKKAYFEKSSKIISGVVFASVAGLALNAFFINSLFFPFIMAWMWILLGLTESN
ncbi:MAG: O-antigen ligase family protein, partial [Candidatus Levybacteria bacterium]|nr:O-antigen ligase family protein [Candidatus Levybacteria bacterium]